VISFFFYLSNYKFESLRTGGLGEGGNDTLFSTRFLKKRTYGVSAARLLAACSTASKLERVTLVSLYSSHCPSLSLLVVRLEIPSSPFDNPVKEVELSVLVLVLVEGLSWAELSFAYV